MLDTLAWMASIGIGTSFMYWLFKECWEEGRNAGFRKYPEIWKYVLWFFMLPFGAFAMGVRYFIGCN